VEQEEVTPSSVRQIRLIAWEKRELLAVPPTWTVQIIIAADFPIYGLLADLTDQF